MDDTNQSTEVQQEQAGNTAEFTFFFRTEKIRDDEGKVIGKGRKHPDVKAVLPVPTREELIAFLSDPDSKEGKMLVDAANDIVFNAAKQQINDWREANPAEADFTPTNFNLAELSFTAIANKPKSERGGPAISDEDWTAFLEDYTNVMINVAQYDPKKVKLHVDHFKVQLRRIKNDKASVQKLRDLLNIWAEKTENLEDHQAAYEALDAKADKYLKAEEKNVFDAL